MATTVPTSETLIARRVARGANEEESRLLLHELIAAHFGDNLASALVYQDFATEAQAQAFVEVLAAPVTRDPMVELVEAGGVTPVFDLLPEPEPRLTAKCNCGAELVWWRGDGDKRCGGCGAWYNAFGQHLRDDWAGNPSNYDDEIGDLEGYEIQHAEY
ncbi:hypothetical protein [Demequina sp.]|uniref:hypothetical protein n=1 Tax=Demequina sp. TaxID=2050685 RepID=UPI003D0E3480